MEEKEKETDTLTERSEGLLAIVLYSTYTHPHVHTVCIRSLGMARYWKQWRSTSIAILCTVPDKIGTLFVLPQI